MKNEIFDTTLVTDQDLIGELDGDASLPATKITSQDMIADLEGVKRPGILDEAGASLRKDLESAKMVGKDLARNVVEPAAEGIGAGLNYMAKTIPSLGERASVKIRDKWRALKYKTMGPEERPFGWEPTLSEMKTPPGVEGFFKRWKDIHQKRIDERFSVDYMKDFIKNPEVLSDPRFWSYGTSNALASVAAFMVPGMGTMRFAKAAGMAPESAAELASVVSALADGTTEAQNVYDDAVKKGKLPETAAGLANNVLMANIPLSWAEGAAFFKNIFKDSKVGQRVVQGLVEGTQEGTQEKISGEAMHSIDPSVDPNAGVAQGALFGAISGGLMPGATPSTADVNEFKRAIWADFANELTDIELKTSGTNEIEQAIEQHFQDQMRPPEEPPPPPGPPPQPGPVAPPPEPVIPPAATPPPVEPAPIPPEPVVPPTTEPETPPGTPTPEEVDQAANEASTSPDNNLPEPTESQIEAGNYKKGHISIHGLDISIENPKGSVRKGVDRAGKPWERVMADHYGYIKRTEGADADHVDVFVGPNPESERIFVVDQVDPDTKKFDEHKALIGYRNIGHARQGYLSNHEQGWQGLGSISEFTVDEFKEWVKSGDTKKAIGYTEPIITEEKPEESPKPKGAAEELDAFDMNDFESLFGKDEPKPSKEAVSQEPPPGAPPEASAKPAEKPRGSKSAADAAKNAAKHGVKGIEGIASGLADLFGVDESTLQSFPAGLNRETYEKAKPKFEEALKEFQAAGKSLKEMAQWLVESWGERIKPYFRYWMQEMKEAGKKEEAKKQGGSSDPMVQEFIDEIHTNEPMSIGKLHQIAKKHTGKEWSDLNVKEVQDKYELALVMAARSVIEAHRKMGRTDKQILNSLKLLYDNQPTLKERDSDTARRQEFSTPIHYAYIASMAAGITEKSRVLEPTAGNGALLIAADPNKTFANEINPDRAANLEEQGFKPTQNDATDSRNYPSSQVGDVEGFDSVIMNPPFGSREENIGGYNIKKLDHIIAIRALAEMSDNGKAAIIIGGQMISGRSIDAEGRVATVGLNTFLNYLSNHYNIDHVIDVDGSIYRKQGTSFPTTMIVISGRKAEPGGQFPINPGSVSLAKNIDELYNLISGGPNEILHTQGTKTEPTGEGAVRGPAPGENRPVDIPGGVPGENTGTNTEVRPEEISGTDRGLPTPVPGGDEGGVAGGDRGRPSVNQPGGLGGRSNVAIPEEGGSEAPGVVGGGEQRTETQPETNEGGVQGNQPRDVSRATSLRPADSDFQINYTDSSSSQGESLDALTPKNLLTPTRNALKKIEEEHGPVDDYVIERVGFRDKEHLFNALSKEQIESVALSISNMEKGKGMIIGHETGIGKGRIAAALMVYAKKQGRLPIFFTAAPNLYSDIYRDFTAIGFPDINPLMTNSKDSKSNIVAEDDEGNKSIIFRGYAGRQRENMFDAILNGEWIGDHDMVFTNYSQIAGEGAKQRAVLNALAQGAILILDESHKAAGSDSNTGAYVRELLSNAHAVTYLSATFAKRPDTLALYWKTDMSMPFASVEELVDALYAGGMPLQTVLSKELAEAGQYMRLEKSYEGVPFNRITKGDYVALAKSSDMVTGFMQKIIGLDSMIAAEIRKIRTHIRKTSPGTTLERTGFGAKMHHVIRQMLLSMKIKSTVDLTVERIQAGEKVVIAVADTMEAFTKSMVEKGQLKVGDPFTPDFNNTLVRALEGTLIYTEEDEYGNSVRHKLDLSELPYRVQELYKEIERDLKDADLSLHASPIDEIHRLLKKAGVRGGELTGRKYVADLADVDNPILRIRPDKERNNRNPIIRSFMDDKDSQYLIINSSAAEGISLHASKTEAKDQRKRVMIVTQPALDINTFMQILGRVHRTGQVVKPEYVLLETPLPIDVRPGTILQKKMGSLNANTTGNKEAETSLNYPDMMNHYGDRIVAEYIRTMPWIQRALPDMVGRFQDTNENAFVKVTGNVVARLFIKDQEQFFNDIRDRFNALINHLNEIEENDLVVLEKPFDAITLDKAKIVEGSEQTTPFGKDTYRETVSVLLTRKPYTEEIIRKKLDNAIGEHTAEEASDRLETKIEEKAKQYKGELDFRGELDDKQKARIDDQKKRAIRFFTGIREGRIPGGRLLIGHEYEIDGVQAVLLDVTFKRKSNTESPILLSNVQAVFAVNSPEMEIHVPLSNFATGTKDLVHLGPLEEGQWGKGPKGEVREEREIITGNLLQGYGVAPEHSRITLFTRQGGRSDMGILLPHDSNLKGRRYLKLDRVLPFMDWAATNVAQGYDRTTVWTHDGYLAITPDKLIADEARRIGGKYYTDEKLTDMTGNFQTGVVAGKFVARYNARIRKEVMARISELAGSKDFYVDEDAYYDAFPSERPTPPAGPGSGEGGRGGVGPNTPFNPYPTEPDGLPETTGYEDTENPWLYRSIDKDKEPLRKSDIRKLIEEKWKIPIRKGLGRVKALGFLRVKAEVIRTKFADDVPVIAHEIGHLIEKRVWGSTKQGGHGLTGEFFRVPPAMRWELMKLASKANDAGNKTVEGFAEFMRHYVTNPIVAEEHYPLFLPWFEKQMTELAPDILKDIQEVRSLWKEFVNQSPYTKALSLMRIGGMPKNRLSIADTIHNAYTKTIDQYHPFSQMMKALGMDPETDPKGTYLLSSLFAGWPGKVKVFLERGTFKYGHVATGLKFTGPSLKSILSPVEKAGKLDDFRVFLLSYRTRDYFKRGLATGQDPKEAEALIKALQTPLLAEAKEKISAYQDAILQYLRDSGVISVDAYDRMKKLNPNYIPLHRIFDKKGLMSEQEGLGKSFADLYDPIFSIKGGTEEIHDVLENIVKNTATFINLAERNRIGRSLLQYVDTEKSGKWIERWQGKIRPSSYDVKQVLNALEKWAGADTGLSKDFAEGFITLFRPAPFTPEHGVLTVFVNGKRKYLRVNDDVYAAMKNLNPPQSIGLFRFMQAFTRVKGAGVTMTFEFAARNLGRDTAQTAIYTDTPLGWIPGVNAVVGLANIIGRTDLYWKWMAEGGAHAAMFSSSRSRLYDTLDKLMGRGTAAGLFKGIIRSPIDMMIALGETLESANRLGENIGLKKMGLDPLLSAYKSREIGTHFSRHGSGRSLQEWSKITRFLNPQIQGYDRMRRGFRDHPVRASLRAMAILTLPALLLWWRNRDDPRYKEISTFTKGVFVIYIPNPISQTDWDKLTPREKSEKMSWDPLKSGIYRIPLPFEIGITFAAMPVAFMDYIADHAQGDARRLVETLTSGLGTNIVPDFVLPIIEWIADKNLYSGAPLVGKDLADLEPEEQYREFTSETAKQIGTHLGVPPVKVENTIRSYLGGVGKYALDLSDEGLRAAGLAKDETLPARSMADVPGFKAFFVRFPSSQSQSIRDFYANLEDIRKVTKTSKVKMERTMIENRDPKGAMDYIMGDLDSAVLSGLFEAASEKINQQRLLQKMIRHDETLDRQEKQILIDAAYFEMIGVAQKANNAYKVSSGMEPSEKRAL